MVNSQCSGKKRKEVGEEGERREWMEGEAEEGGREQEAGMGQTEPRPGAGVEQQFAQECDISLWFCSHHC